METNLHHHEWEARQWRKFRLANEIRNHHLMKSLMVVSIHKELHAHVPPITPPEASTAKFLLNHINELPSYYASLDAAKSIYDELYDEAPEYSEHLGKQIPFLKLSAIALARRVV